MIKRINATQAYPLRQAILRPDGDINECIFDGDELETTQHFGYIDKGELVGIASVYQRTYQGYQGRGLQLRSMAVASSVQGQGIGQKLLTAMCEELMDDVDYLWANARVSALGFYCQANFDIDNNVFEIAGVGPHQHIVKWF